MLRQLVSQFSQVQNCPNNPQGNPNCNTGIPEVPANAATLEVVLQLVFGTLTAVAIIIIVIQGIRFILSNGEPDKAAAARKGVIYALVGLAVVFSADIIVFFVLGNVL